MICGWVLASLSSLVGCGRLPPVDVGPGAPQERKKEQCKKERDTEREQERAGRNSKPTSNNRQRRDSERETERHTRKLLNVCVTHSGAKVDMAILCWPFS